MNAKQKYQNYLASLLGKVVKTSSHKRKQILGFVVSIEQDVANIRDYRANKKSRPQLHYHVGEIRELTQKEAIELGKEMEAGHL